MFRWFFALKAGWRNREELKRFLRDPDKRVGSLAEITPERLENANVGVLVLDFDGVLAPHGAMEPLPQVKAWLRNLSNHIGEQRIALLTNKPFSSRLAYFTQEFPSIYIAHVRRKKPYPDGLLQIAEYKGIERHRLALLDDRLLTGMLATCLAYTQGLYFYKPYRNLLRRPITETFFSFLRIVERVFISCV